MTTDDATDESTDESTRAADARAEAIQAAAQAARRAENGEFIFLTHAEVAAFVNALPAGVRVRWTFESASLLTIQHYRVTFWRSFWLLGSAGVTRST